MRRMGLIEQRLSLFCDADVQVWHAPLDAQSNMSQRLLRQVQRWLNPAEMATPGIRSAQRDRSISHAGNSVFALAVRSRAIAGVGIDFESWRELDARHQRLMLTAQEMRRMKGAVNAQELLRIWTVKEACFKADVSGQQRWVTSYELDDPGSKTGWARIVAGRRINRFRYISMEVPGGILSVALKMGVE